jgi:hypothetical protein
MPIWMEAAEKSDGRRKDVEEGGTRSQRRGRRNGETEEVEVEVGVRAQGMVDG